MLSSGFFTFQLHKSRVSDLVCFTNINSNEPNVLVWSVELIFSHNTFLILLLGQKPELSGPRMNNK